MDINVMGLYKKKSSICIFSIEFETKCQAKEVVYKEEDAEKNEL